MINELYHFGIKGMKWGIRRYQNKDGTLTKARRRRAQKDANSLSKAMSKELDSTNDFQRSTKRIYLVDKQGNNRWDKNGEKFVSEITKDYGKFDSSKQIEFKPMFKD